MSKPLLLSQWERNIFENGADAESLTQILSQRAFTSLLLPCKHAREDCFKRSSKLRVWGIGCITSMQNIQQNIPYFPWPPSRLNVFRGDAALRDKDHVFWKCKRTPHHTSKGRIQSVSRHFPSSSPAASSLTLSLTSTSRLSSTFTSSIRRSTSTTI